MHWVYVLKSGAEKWIYIGRTRHLRGRLWRHKKGLIPETRSKRPLEIIYFERHTLRKNAKQREKLLRDTDYGKVWIDEVALNRNWRSIQKLRTIQPSFL